MLVSIFVPVAVLISAGLLHWLAGKFTKDPVKPDGAPGLTLVRLSAGIDVVIALILLALALLTHGRLVHLIRLWPRDPLLSVLIGAIAGLLLHAVDGGSPLPMQALRPLRVASTPPDSARQTNAGLPTVTLFVAGECAAEFIWRGIALGMLAQQIPVLPAIVLTAGAYGLRRAAAGQDHALLGAVDGMLLGVLFRLTRSLPAAIVAHLLADILAYTSSADARDLDVASVELTE